MIKALCCLMLLIGIFIGIGLTMLAIWINDNEVYPEELEEEET